jgi:hypothetical protein
MGIAQAFFVYTFIFQNKIIYPASYPMGTGYRGLFYGAVSI